jgi:hypothetical protein
MHRNAVGIRFLLIRCAPVKNGLAFFGESPIETVFGPATVQECYPETLLAVGSYNRHIKSFLIRLAYFDTPPRFT